ncbi:MAG: hypothetical protein K9M45_11150 [Kiritimatiellales bacterium]|nr:hypothetical protein [Kiritimatiellales bacterium]
MTVRRRAVLVCMLMAAMTVGSVIAGGQAKQVQKCGCPEGQCACAKVKTAKCGCPEGKCMCKAKAAAKLPCGCAVGQCKCK